ncbi:MAG: pyrroline-5-carboxylate reductase [Candidatus Aenigmarchaeota archaeon]|nr:pyrroline-5-carboxylate reductase [Candidatus Aenigmarchaeota archaeon]
MESSIGTIGFIGAGNMAEAMIKSLLVRGYNGNIVASRRSVEQLERLNKTYEIETTTDNRKVAEQSDVVVFSVKPQSLDTVMEGLAGIHLGERLVLSIAAGKRTSYFEQKLGSQTRICRAMPNIGFFYGCGVSAYYLNGNCSENEEKNARYILEAGGPTYRVNESDMDVVTALSGSGPAFFSYFLSCMEEKAIKMGLQERVAHSLLTKTVEGTAEFLKANGLSYTEFIDKVASKGGTTEAGISFAKTNGIKEGISGIIDAAAKRSRELGLSGMNINQPLEIRCEKT